MNPITLKMLSRSLISTRGIMWLMHTLKQNALDLVSDITSLENELSAESDKAHELAKCITKQNLAELMVNLTILSNQYSNDEIHDIVNAYLTALEQKLALERLGL